MYGLLTVVIGYTLLMSYCYIEDEPITSKDEK